MDKSKFKNGRVHFRNSGMKGIGPLLLFTLQVSEVSSNGPCHGKACLQAYADNEGPHQPIHLCTSLFANKIIGYYRMFQCKSPDEIWHLYRMTWIHTFYACSKIPFRLALPKYWLRKMFHRISIACSVNSLFVLFGSYVTFNSLSVISRWCLDVSGSSRLIFRVLSHWNIMFQIILYWHQSDQIWFYLYI